MYNKFFPSPGSNQKSFNNPQTYIPLFSTKNFFLCVKILLALWILIYIFIVTNYSKDIETKIEEENRIIDKFQDKLMFLMQHGIKIKNSVIDRFKIPDYLANYTFDPNNPMNLDGGISEQAQRFIKELNLTNPGENGVPIKLPNNASDQVKRLIKYGFDTFGYNQFISTLVSLNRALPDVRPDECKQKVYRTDKFSKISIVIPFYNDDWHLLMRTVHSIIRMTPLEYILEILLVDDCSTMQHLKEPLENYTATLPVNTRIIRSHTRLGTNATPTWDPKIAPIGIFAVLAIGNKFYERIEYLDIDMDVWGGEDYELVFRTWLCGGRVEFVPCSNIAHMFRKHKYSINLKGKGGYPWNMARIVETWMDDYKQYFYRVIKNSRVPYGDLTERMQLKKRLNCKPFQWYIDNVYPRLNDIPKRV
ncbi:unnamed protein product [Chironomus riparius]|uniref:Uncharacterized protein n=1 Tax=Chironomus riparius TaxID=315576 RepID=A0A9N9S5W0_9DIPT|nr:unnamed protein product [Chironomus riparius]